MWRRIIVLVAVLVLVPALFFASLLTSFQASFPTAAILQLRNLSTEPVFVELGSPNNGFFGWFKGVSYERIEVDPWQAGWCSALRIGVKSGVESVTLSGPAIQSQPTHSWNVAVPAAGDEVDLNLVVDSGGTTVFDGTMPPDHGSCMGYPEGLGGNGG